MTQAFPEIAAALSHLPADSVFDGELVALADGKLDFDVLQRRLAAGKANGARLSRQSPATLVLFDVLALDGEDMRGEPFDTRRGLLEELRGGIAPPLMLSPFTADLEQARQWFEELAAAGIEGIMAKGARQPHRPGERQWLKVKRREVVDVVIGAVIGSMSHPETVVVGSFEEGRLSIVGRSTPLGSSVSRQLGTLLEPPSDEHPWPAMVKPGALSRFGSGKLEVRLTLVKPVCAEVSADSARTGSSFRHMVRFVRLRPDLAVDEVS